MSSIVQYFSFQAATIPTPIQPRYKDCLHYFNVGNYKIPLLYFPYDNSNCTIVYSHGNASELGHLCEFLFRMCIDLKVNILAYEYIGYGLTRNTEMYDRGTPTENNTYKSLIGALKWLSKQSKQTEQSKQSNSNHKVILLGRSIGSGPTIQISVKEVANKIFNTNLEFIGVILISPFMSIIKTQVNNSLLYNAMYYMDIFCNYEKIKYITVPILFIHGLDDHVVCHRNTLSLVDILYKENQTGNKDVYTLFIKNCGHNDITSDHYLTVIKEIKSFLNNIF